MIFEKKKDAGCGVGVENTENEVNMPEIELFPLRHDLFLQGIDIHKEKKRTNNIFLVLFSIF